MDRREDSPPLWFTATAVGLLLVFVALALYAFRGVWLPGPRRPVGPDARIAGLTAIVRNHPTDTRARLELGLAYQAEKHYSKAIEQYGYILEQEPGNTAALFNRGLSYEALQRDGEAEQSFLAVLAAQPDHLAAARALGELYLGRGRYEDVVRTIGPVADARRNVAYLHYLVGVAHERLGERDRAASRYRQAIDSPGGLRAAQEALDGLER